jgi:hypothetical protein
MAQFSRANLETVESKWTFRPKTLKDAVTTAKAGTAALITALDGIADDNGIAAAMRVKAEVMDNALGNLEQISIDDLADILATYWQSTDTSPDDLASAKQPTFDSWYTNVKTGATNPLLTNELVMALRRKFGDSAVSAANASPPAADSFGTVAITGAAACTLTPPTAYMDTTKYGGALLEIYVTNAFGSETTLTFTGLLADGVTPWTSAALVVPNLSAIGYTAEIIPSTAKTYAAKITAVTVSGGTADDAFTIRVKTPRAIAA